MVNYSTIDHALGSPKGRYFGQGHRRSVYSFTPTSVFQGGVAGICAVQQEGLWSEKDTGTVSRHLSTIDAVSLAGLALESVFHLEPVNIEALFVTEVSIRAGAAATEDLNAVPLEATVVWNLATRAFDCAVTVGTMRLTMAVESVAAPIFTATSEGEPKFFAQHLQSRFQHISDIDINCDAGNMQAKLGALAAQRGPTGHYSGLQSAHFELFSISEAIVCLAQLAQTMAYEFDQISRDESAVFWLRRLSVSLTAPRLRVGQIIAVDIQVARSSELRIAGEPWRTLRLTAEAPGLTALADVAHILPKVVEA